MGVHTVQEKTVVKAEERIWLMRKIAVSAYMHINNTIKLILLENKSKHLNNNIITDTILW